MSGLLWTQAAHQPATFKVSHWHDKWFPWDISYSPRAIIKVAFFLGKFINMIAFFTLCWVRLSQKWTRNPRNYFDIHKIANEWIIRYKLYIRVHNNHWYPPITSIETGWYRDIGTIGHMMTCCRRHICSRVCHRDRVKMLMVGLGAWSCEKVSKAISASINFDKRRAYTMLVCSSQCIIFVTVKFSRVTGMKVREVILTIWFQTPPGPVLRCRVVRNVLSSSWENTASPLQLSTPTLSWSV